MKRILLHAAYIAIPAYLLCAQDGYGFLKVSPGCANCHSFAGGAGLHTKHGAQSCAACHGEPSSDVMAHSCTACHPRGGPGKCELILLPGHPAAGAQECLGCHNICAPAITTTSSTTTSITAAQCPSQSALGDDATALDSIRDFRDSRLAQSAAGRMLAAAYYRNADAITAALEKSPLLKALTRRVLFELAPMLAK